MKRPVEQRLDHVRVAAIGASLGAIDALPQILSRLPISLRIPLLLVVHIPADVPSLLPEVLSLRCDIPIRHAAHGMSLEPGTIHVAPPANHLLVDRPGVLALSDAPPLRFSRPSIDALFLSVAQHYGAAGMGIVLTGANEDGAAGLGAIARGGGVTVVQAPFEAAAPSMPNAAIRTASPDAVLPLAEIGELLASMVWPAA